MDDFLVDVAVAVIDLLVDIFSDSSYKSRNSSYGGTSKINRKNWKPTTFKSVDPINNVTSDKMSSPSVVTSGMVLGNAEYVDDSHVVKTVPYSKQKEDNVPSTDTKPDPVFEPVEKEQKDVQQTDISVSEGISKNMEDVSSTDNTTEDKVDNSFEAFSKNKDATSNRELVNNVKLQILMLNYMFFEDDMKLSLIEKNQIKKHMSQYKGVLKQQDLTEIKEYSTSNLSVDTINAFVSKYNISQFEINKATFELNQYNSNGKYTNLINFIKRYVRESGY